MLNLTFDSTLKRKG